MELDVVRRRRGPLPSALMKYICEPPSTDSTTASVLPSGDQAGAEFEPRKCATAKRLPSVSECTYTTGFFASNETYARRRPSGDHTGEMIGSSEASAVSAPAPSASAICTS